ncbi:MAG: RluA family pseudouridine synthase [Gemmatimonadota bacterium]
MVAFSVAAPVTERLDRFLADQLSFSRTQVGRLVADGRVKVNGEVARASRLLAARQQIEVDIPDDAPLRVLTPHPIDLKIEFEDEHLAVLDKPAGLVVHPAPGHWDDTLVNALVARGTSLSSSGDGRPGIVHRLDRDTSGLMVIAKSDLAHRRLGAAIAARRVHRAYAVLAWGHLAESPLDVSVPVGRHPTDRKRMIHRPDGRTARTSLSVVARFEVAELLRAELHTGRTHQIRVHLEHIGHPVVGDLVYSGGGPRRISGAARAHAERLSHATTRQALHAAELRFRHPITGSALAFRSEWPADLSGPLDLLQTLAGHVAPPMPLTYLGFFAGSND